MTELPSQEPQAPPIVKVAGLAIGPAIDLLIRELGESPEAWRGAMELHDILRVCVTKVLAVTPEGGETDAKLSIIMSGTAVMTALIDFANHPTTKLMAKLIWKEADK